MVLGSGEGSELLECRGLKGQKEEAECNVPICSEIHQILEIKCRYTH